MKKGQKERLEEEENSEELKKGIEEGEKDEDIYKETASEIMQDEDEITNKEGGIIEGYEEDLSKCAVCGKIISDEKKAVELKINGQHYMFCSEKHAAVFKKQNKK